MISWTHKNCNEHDSDRAGQTPDILLITIARQKKGCLKNTRPPVIPSKKTTAFAVVFCLEAGQLGHMQAALLAAAVEGGKHVFQQYQVSGR